MERNGRTRLGRQARDIAPRDRNPAGIRSEHAGDDPHQRGLASAVRPDQTEELAAFDREAHPGDGGHATEADGERIDFESRRH
jgi:hypothetical protein